MQNSPQRRTQLVASIVVIVLLAGALGYFYVTSSGTIASLNSTVSSQNGVISAQASTISAQSASIGGLQSTVTAQASSISGLQANITAYAQLKAELRAMIAQDTSEIASLNGTVAADAAQINSLNQQIATANSMISTLTQTVDLQLSTTLVSNQGVTIYGTIHASSKPFVTFSPQYAGYVLVQVSSATQPYFLNATAAPTNSNAGGGVFQYLTFLAPSSSATITYFVIPIAPGSENSLDLLTDTTADGTATVTATYYY